MLSTDTERQNYILPLCTQVSLLSSLVTMLDIQISLLCIKAIQSGSAGHNLGSIRMLGQLVSTKLGRKGCCQESKHYIKTASGLHRCTACQQAHLHRETCFLLSKKKLRVIGNETDNRMALHKHCCLIEQLFVNY